VISREVARLEWHVERMQAVRAVNDLGAGNRQSIDN
jgi:hypothetical protein